MEVHGVQQMRFLDFPDSIQHLALFMDSPGGMIFIAVSIVQLVTVLSMHIRLLQASRLVRILVTGSLLILPLITVACLYVAGLPKA